MLDDIGQEANQMMTEYVLKVIDISIILQSVLTLLQLHKYFLNCAQLLVYLYFPDLGAGNVC